MERTHKKNASVIFKYFNHNTIEDIITNDKAHVK